ncbi:MAG: peptidylprolyl isomerase [Geobacteraceae bacterium]|nr:peptidylprolyl isomerase [Geobacteraceae bacterium]
MLKKVFMAMAIGILACGTACAASGKARNPVVLVDTSLGKITIELYQDKAPVSVNNFLQYARNGFYSGTVFHRVIPGFMIQGGGFSEKLQQKETRAPIKNEASNGLKNQRGTIALARTANPDSATSQFFINLVDNPNLNRPMPDGSGYAVFGRVIKGMDTVDRIASVRTGVRNGFQDVPQAPVIIKSVSILK